MKKRFGGPQIVAKLRQADVLIGQGKTVPEVCKDIDISQPYHPCKPTACTSDKPAGVVLRQVWYEGVSLPKTPYLFNYKDLYQNPDLLSKFKVC